MNFVFGLVLTPVCTMADCELIQFSFSSVIGGHHVSKSTIWRNVTGSTHLRMRIATECGDYSRAATIFV